MFIMHEKICLRCINDQLAFLGLMKNMSKVHKRPAYIVGFDEKYV